MTHTTGTSTALKVGDHFQTDLPDRLDRLPWSKWHWKIVIALGITWILDRKKPGNSFLQEGVQGRSSL